MKQSSNKIDDNRNSQSQLTKKALWVIGLVLLVDQVSKFWVKTQMYLDESISVFGDWFFIHFIENPGMAFGFEFGGELGKLSLSIFRIVAVIVIGFYLRNIIRQRMHAGFIVSVALVLAGAAGNIIDSAFYGLIFNESPRFSPETAELFPASGGYASFLHGRVVDMLYFPIIDGHWPEWVPGLGGDRFQFFRPVFNIADSAISVGMAIILIKQKKYFNTAPATELVLAEESDETNASEQKVEANQDAK